MKRLKYISFLLIAVNSSTCFSQTAIKEFFNSQYINGEIKFSGLFREQKSKFGEISEDQKSIYYIGGIMVNTGSFLWNPDLIYINLDVEYNPESRKETFLLMPDRSEVRTLKKIDFRTSVFRNKTINLNTFVNLNQTYFNRELLTNIRSDSKQWGGIISANNKILPISVSFRQSDWLQKELQTDRTFNMSQKNIIGTISKSFGQYDRHEFIVSRDDYLYNYDASGKISSVIDRFFLSNDYYFDKERKYNFNSLISYNNQSGDNKFTKLEAIERLTLLLPVNLRFTGGYNYYKLTDPFQYISQNKVSGTLNHRLFESLTTNIYADYSAISQSVYEEKDLRTGLEISYTKKIPASGRINLNYRYYSSFFENKGVSASVKIYNEEHILSDGKIILLNKPFVNLSTVVIRDQAGVIIYRLNLDYILIARNDYVEIQRVPGGQIADNQPVKADYSATKPGSFSFQTNNNSFSASVILFKRLLELYFRGSLQNYMNLKSTDFLSLNHFTQNIYGARIDFGFGGIGAEYDNYASNIIPYKRYRYFIDLNWSFKAKFIVSVNGNILDYKLIDNEENQIYSNITGKIAYNINYKTKIGLEGGYLKQTGRNIDLELLTSKLELSTSFRQLQIRGGVEMYRRNYLNSNFDFIGTFIELIRKF